jgi:hypothetical protein
MTRSMAAQATTAWRAATTATHCAAASAPTTCSATSERISSTAVAAQTSLIRPPAGGQVLSSVDVHIEDVFMGVNAPTGREPLSYTWHEAARNGIYVDDAGTPPRADRNEVAVEGPTMIRGDAQDTQAPVAPDGGAGDDKVWNNGDGAEARA